MMRRLSVRRKPSSRTGTIEVYTNVRLPGVKHPRRLHICYLPAGTLKLSACTENKLREKATVAFRKVGLETDSEIDWENFCTKLMMQGTSATPAKTVDREPAKRQIEEWYKSAAVLPEFAEAKTGSSGISGCQFQSEFLTSHTRFIKFLPNVDEAEFATWWETSEAPRLLISFYRFVLRKQGDGKGLLFTNEQFLVFLNGRTTRFVIEDFMRVGASRFGG